MTCTHSRFSHHKLVLAIVPSPKSSLEIKINFEQSLRGYRTFADDVSQITAVGKMMKLKDHENQGGANVRICDAPVKVARRKMVKYMF